MFGFRRLDVYQCVVTVLPLACCPRRAEVEPLEELLVRIVAMLTKMAAR